MYEKCIKGNWEFFLNLGEILTLSPALDFKCASTKCQWIILLVRVAATQFMEHFHSDVSVVSE